MRNLFGRVRFLVLVLVFALLLPGAAMAQQDPNADRTSPSRKAPSEALKKEIAENEAKLDRGEKKNNKRPELRIDKDPEGNPYVAGELIVSFEKGATGSTTRASVAATVAGARVEEDLPQIDAAVLSVPEAKNEISGETREGNLERTKRTLEADPNVKAVDYNYVARPQQSNDPLVGQQWGLSRIRAPQAWSTSTGEQTVVAVLDSGVQNSHPDLNGAVVDEWDFFHNRSAAVDDSGHGTHVSGIVGAFTNNGRGIAATAPDAFLFDYKVCNGQQGCPLSAQIPAIVEAADMNADVINLSLAGYGRSFSQERAVNYAWGQGTVVVAAAGNDATNQLAYPAAYANVIAVTATDFQNGDSDFSNYGTWVNVTAPGGELRGPLSAPRHQILSSYPTYLNRSGYLFNSGTSFAAPMVSGVAALLAEQNLSATQIRQRIESTATDIGPRGRDNLFGTGLLNAQGAVTNRPSAKSADTSQVSVTPSKK